MNSSRDESDPRWSGRGAHANDLLPAYCCDFCCCFASFLFLWCWYSAPPAAPSAAPFLPPTMAPPAPPTIAPLSLLCFFGGACCAGEPCASAFSSARAALVAVVSRKAAPSSAEPILFVREIPAMVRLPRNVTPKPCSSSAHRACRLGRRPDCRSIRRGCPGGEAAPHQEHRSRDANPDFLRHPERPPPRGRAGSPPRGRSHPHRERAAAPVRPGGRDAGLASRRPRKLRVQPSGQEARRSCRVGRSSPGPLAGPLRAGVSRRRVRRQAADEPRGGHLPQRYRPCDRQLQRVLRQRAPQVDGAGRLPEGTRSDRGLRARAR